MSRTTSSSASTSRTTRSRSRCTTTSASAQGETDMTNDNNTQIAADLRAAAGLIRVGGLVYGQYYSKRRPGPTAYCAVGAIIRAVNGLDTTYFDRSNTEGLRVYRAVVALAKHFDPNH